MSVSIKEKEGVSAIERNKSNQIIKHASYAGVDLSGCNFSSSVIEFCDFRGANLQHCDLSKAFIASCNFGNCNLKGVNAVQSICKSVYFTGADLSRSFVRNSMLDSAVLNKVNFEGAYLTYCGFVAADLDAANLHDAVTLDSSFSEAKLHRTEQFFLCREVVLEVVKRTLPASENFSEVLGRIRFSKWCYLEWGTYLSSRPELMATAENIFREYPHSFVWEALTSDWEYSAGSDPDAPAQSS